MTEKMPIKSLTIKGFLSIQNLENFPINDLNVLIGSNGAGKSNFITYFKMLGKIAELGIQDWVSRQGSIDRILSFGINETKCIESRISFVDSAYQFKILPSLNSSSVYFNDQIIYEFSKKNDRQILAGNNNRESLLKSKYESEKLTSLTSYCYQAISSWKVYHFHDTGDTALMKRKGALHDNEYFRTDGSNLAAFLFRIAKESPETYEKIRQTIQLAIPFFDDFILKPETLKTEEQLINLQWKQKNSDYPFWPSQLSDGSIRFICLTTALLQPEPPTTIIIDEPELGLHPYAIALLASMLRSASKRMQVIVSTQSIALVNEFEIEDLIVVEREKGASIFKRLKNKDYNDWLKKYSVGELWDKNILGGRPNND